MAPLVQGLGGPPGGPRPPPIEERCRSEIRFFSSYSPGQGLGVHTGVHIGVHIGVHCPPPRKNTRCPHRGAGPRPRGFPGVHLGVHRPRWWNAALDRGGARPLLECSGPPRLAGFRVASPGGRPFFLYFEPVPFLEPAIRRCCRCQWTAKAWPIRRNPATNPEKTPPQPRANPIRKRRAAAQWRPEIGEESIRPRSTAKHSRKKWSRFYSGDPLCRLGRLSAAS